MILYKLMIFNRKDNVIFYIIAIENLKVFA